MQGDHHVQFTRRHAAYVTALEHQARMIDSQIQLLQIFFTIAFSALFFGEHVEPITWVFACGVIATVMLGRKTAVKSNVGASLLAKGP